MIDKGDTVRLNSGGPEMTVDAVHGSVLYCHWGTGEAANFHHFPADTVCKVDPTKKSAEEAQCP